MKIELPLGFFLSPLQKSAILAVCAFALTSARSESASATWQLDPPSNDWNSPGNWMPHTVPNSPSDIATFLVSHQPDVSVTQNTEVNNIVFAAGASAFQITAETLTTLTLSGAGIENNSGLEQNFVVATSSTTTATGTIAFTRSAAAGSGTTFTVQGSTQPLGRGGLVTFTDSAKAGNASFVLDGGTMQNSPGGSVDFKQNSSAENATFTILGASGSGFSYGGGVQFQGTASAGNATFICEPSTNPNGFRGGGVVFVGGATAGQSTMVVNGGISLSSTLAYFGDHADAGTSNITVNPGPQGSGKVGGSVELVSNASAENAKVILHGYPEHGPEDALLDIHFHSGPAPVGSLSGDGAVQLGVVELVVGAVGDDTTFSGPIRDEEGKGLLTKTGAGRLILRGVSSYGGGTTVREGELSVSTASGSGTGSGPVVVAGGLLSGDGIIGGPVTIESDGVLFPNPGLKKPSLLTIQGSLTFDDGALYTAFINTRKHTADQVSANGISIGSGAKFNLETGGTKRLPLGRVFVLLNNTSGGQINGEFANLPEGATIATPKNTFRVSYEGGDGNDLTLTAVPRS